MANGHGRLLDSGDARAVARGLGWFSLGLGLAEVAASRGLAAWLGMEGRTGLVRAYGAREIATGLAILLSRDDPAPWIRARVGGDALDLATLVAAGLDGDNPRKGNVGLALAAVADVTALDVACPRALDGAA
jgi:hypothetical protein